MRDLPPNAASPTQPHQSWMRRGASAPHAVVGVGLCHNLVNVSDICLLLISLYRTGQDGHERVKTEEHPTFFYPVTCTLFLQLVFYSPPQPFPWIRFPHLI